MIGSVTAGAALAAAAYLAGVYLIWRRPRLSQRASAPLVSFAGGVVVGASLLHLLPRAARLSEQAYWVALAAFLVLYLIESHTLPHIHETDAAHEHPATPARGLVILVIAGFAFHAWVDGLAIAAGYSGGAELGRATVLAVCAHKVPEGVATVALLLHWHFARGRALRLAWLLALVTPAAAVGSYALLGINPEPVYLGPVLAAVAGSLLYIGGADLLPEIRKEPSALTSSLIVAGAAVMGLLHLLH